MTDTIDIHNAEHAMWNHSTQWSCYPPVEVERNLEAMLLGVWGSGFAEEETGTVEYGPGHHFRVGNFIVRTDSQGFTYTYCYGSPLTAIDQMSLVRDVYDAIDGLEEN